MKITIDFDTEAHRQLCVLAKKQGKSVLAIIHNTINDKLKQERLGLNNNKGATPAPFR